MDRAILAAWLAPATTDGSSIAMGIRRSFPFIRKFIAIPKGDPRNPLNWDELVMKFRTNAMAALPEGPVDKLAATILDLETVADVSELVRLCRPGDKIQD